MHALVTGGGGFLGRYIVEQLVRRGDRVRSFGRREYPELEAMGVEVVRGDIEDRDAVHAACRDIDCVFHTAARTGIGGRWPDYFNTNVVGTEQVLTGCQREGVSRLVYTSSPSVVFAGTDQRGVDESLPYSFEWLRSRDCHYSHSKALAEDLALGFRGKEIDFNTGEEIGEEFNLRSCSLRPHLIWGPRDNHLIPRLLARARNGKLRRVGGGANLVDISYVENVAEAHLLAADALADESSPLIGKAYFISQGEPVNCWQWIDEILALAGLPPVRKAISARAAMLAGTVCEEFYRRLRLRGEPPMTRFLAAQLAVSHWFDISAARRDLGYQPRISTAEGMRRLGQWLRP